MAHNQLSRTADNLLAATAGLTGDRFFAALAKALAENLGMRWAFVGEIKNAHISVLAGYGNGAPIDPFDYELRGSACEQVLTQDSGSYRADVAKTFPEDKLLGDLGIESYFGITVRSVAGHPIGIINAMDDKPIAEPPKCAGLLQLYALRVGSEIERRRLKQQLIHSQKLESLGVLTGGIVHAFNNLLAGILGDIENALSATPADNHNATRPLHDATVAARAAGELTQQLLAYAGASGSNRQPIAVAKHIEETVAMTRCMLASETKLHTSIPGGTPNVIADPSQLRQVLINLVFNANESLEGAAGTVTIALGIVAANSPDFDHLHHRSDNFTPNAEHVAISVRDTGAGLGQADIAQVSEHSSSSKGTSGGLGLSDVIGILGNHDGAIAIDTNQEHGSTFTVYFPTTSQAVPAVTDIPPMSSHKSQRVLVVDDNDIVRRTLVRTLERLGYTTTEAATGEEALKIIATEETSFDCMVIDRIMPGLTGPQLIDNIRTLDTDVPIVLTTGFGDADDLPAGLICCVLSKPWTAKDVTTAMRTALGQADE